MLSIAAALPPWVNIEGAEGKQMEKISSKITNFIAKVTGECLSPHSREEKILRGLESMNINSSTT